MSNEMSLNKHLVYKSVAFANSDTPFSFFQTNVITEPDRAYFPYTNWFRGEYTNCFPIIADREAGFRPIITGVQSVTGCNFNDGDLHPQNCFRGATQQSKNCYTNGTQTWLVKDPTYLTNNRLFLYS